MAENHENSKGSISDPDISAFQKYMNTPWDHEKGFMQIPRDTPKPYQTKNFLIFDITEVDAGIARTQALDVFGNHYMDFAESNIFTPLSQKGDPRHEEMRNEFRDFIDHMKSKIDIGMASLHGAGGGIADLDLDMALIDRRAMNFSGRIGALFQNPEGPVLDKTKEFHYGEFVRHHEAAHAVLGLQEPGADFAAAVMTLKEHPEARETVQILADLRLSEGMANGYENFSLYGAECQMAIQEAMELSPEELQKLDSKKLYEMAGHFDQLAAGNDAVYIRSKPSPEFVLHDKIQGWDTQDKMSFVVQAAGNLGEGIKSTLKEVWDSAAKGKFPEFTSIRAYLDDMRQSVDDMNKHPLAMQETARQAMDDPHFPEKSIARDLDGAVTRLSGYVYGAP